MRGTLMQRFMAKVSPEPMSGCWLWTGATSGSGYGIIRVGSVNTSAHRVSWRLFRGEIPDGLWVLHWCDNVACVAPTHLFLGTAQANVDDMIAKGRKVILAGEEAGGARLTLSEVRDIRSALERGLLQREVAAMFGVSGPTISHIKTGRRWRNAS